MLVTYTRRTAALQAGATGRELPAVSCTKQTILDLTLGDYQAHADAAEEGFRRARQFLWREKIFSARDLPYRTQLVPLSTILISLGDRWQDDAIRQKVRQWYWCGVLGEQYGSTTESRFARDLPEVTAWTIEDGPMPQTLRDCNFVTDRLMSLRSRLSAAYKGLHALIMQSGGALDWRTGAGTDEQTYFDESIDIHHIFPRAWCDRQKIGSSIYNSILNKTALSGRTNRFLGGDAPTIYLRRLQERRLFEWDENAMTPDGRVLLTREALATCNDFGDWVRDHRHQVPEQFPFDGARDAFAATYPFHPTVLSVFERKWQALPRFQQTRGILRLLALWVARKRPV